MLGEREDLQEIIQTELTKRAHDDKFFNDYMHKLKERISPKKLSFIFSGKMMFSHISTNQLYHLASFIHETTNSELINPVKWFNNKEIIEAKNEYVNNSQESESTYTFSDVSILDDRTWITRLSYRELTELRTNGTIIYNFDTQRDPIIKYKHGQKIIIPRQNSTAVNEISKEMLSGEFESNAIVLNITATGSEVFEYDSENRTLTFMINADKDELSELALVDGQHRSSGAEKALVANPMLEGYFAVMIKNLTVPKAQSFIVQEQKKNEISKELIKTFDINNEFMRHARQINEYGDTFNNELYNKIATDRGELLHDKYVMFSVFADNLKEHFEDIFQINDTARGRQKVYRYIVDYFNVVIDVQRSHFNNITTARENTILLSDRVWYIYLYIARQLYSSNKLEIVEDIIKSQDWNKSNSLWSKEILLTHGSFNINAQRKTKKYFDDLIIKYSQQER